MVGVWVACCLVLASDGAPRPVVPDAVTTQVAGVTIDSPATGVTRLRRPSGAAGVARLAEVPVPDGPLAVGAEIRCDGLWHRDAVVRVTWLGRDGAALGSFATPPVYRTSDWTPVTACGSPPAGADSARVSLELAGNPRDDLDAGCWAEFREIATWDAPRSERSGPPLGVAWSPTPLALTLRLALPAGARLSAELRDGFGNAVRTWPAATGGRLALRAQLPAGYYELRWRAVRADGSTLREGREAYAVLDGAARPTDSPFAMDAGFSWGIIQQGEPQAAEVAALLAHLGLRTVRDRYSFSGTWPAPDRFEPGPYEAAARVQRDAGLTVYSIFHDLPRFFSAWPDAPEPWQAPPADLRDIHRAMRTIADRMRGLWAAFELWNEPDIPAFFDGRPEEYAGLLKAGYLGLKAGDEDLNVLIGSAAMPLGDWLRGVFDCGAADYYDTFNWHTYHPNSRLPAMIAEFRGLGREHGYDAPQWLTETGALAGPDSASERSQAADYVKRYVLAASDRIERVFAFYLQEWREPGSPPYGVIRPDLSPRPALVALAALTSLLGRGEPLGADPRLPGYWFESGAGPVLVAWSDEPRPWPAAIADAQVRSLFGAAIPRPAELTGDPVYVVGLAPPAGLTPPPPAPTRRARTAAELVALSVVLDARLEPAEDAAPGSAERKQPPRVAPGDRVPGEVSIYAFGTRPATVRPRAVAPDGWHIEGLPEAVAVRPGERARLPFTLVVGPFGDLAARPAIRLEGAAEGFRIAPVTIRCGPAVDRLRLERVRPLASLPAERDRWTASSNAATTIVLSTPPNAPDRLRLSAVLAAPTGDRWGFVNVALTAAEALTDGAGIRFGLAPVGAWTEDLLVILFEDDGSQWVANAGSMADGADRTVTLPWPSFTLNAGVSSDENGRLDLAQVRRIGLGLSARTSQTRGACDLWGLELIRVGDAP